MNENKIICEIKFGTLYQKVYIMNNNDIEQYHMLISQIPGFINKFDIKDVYIKGNKHFSSQIEFNTQIIQHEFNQKDKKIFHYIEGE